MPAIKETYLINETNFQSFRLVGNDIDPESLDPYILEAQYFDLRPILNDAFYADFLLRVKLTADGLFTVYQELLNGKDYTVDGVKVRFPGIIPFLVYMAFGRFVIQHPVQVTRFGLVTKNNDQSTPADPAMIKMKALAAKDNAGGYQLEIIKFLDELSSTYPLWDSEGKSGNVFNNTGIQFFKG